MSTLYPYFRLLRPEQWLKNAFVFVGFFFSRQWSNFPLFIDTLIVAFSFCLISSAVYILNDVLDYDHDLLHPKKKFRPIASHQVSISSAYLLGGALLVGALVAAFAVNGVNLVILLIYLVVNIFYSFFLKHVVILDVFCICSGFILRLLAGTVGLHIPPSRWLLICGLMISLFFGFTKRRAEMGIGGKQSVQQRPVLKLYTREMLDQFVAISAAVVILSYSLYTVSEDTIALHGSSRLIWTVPFVIFGLLRYIYITQQEGGGESPSTDLIRDPYLCLTAVGWIALTFSLLAR